MKTLSKLINYIGRMKGDFKILPVPEYEPPKRSFYFKRKKYGALKKRVLNYTFKGLCEQ